MLGAAKGGAASMEATALAAGGWAQCSRVAPSPVFRIVTIRWTSFARFRLDNRLNDAHDWVGPRAEAPGSWKGLTVAGIGLIVAWALLFAGFVRSSGDEIPEVDPR